MVGQVQVGDGEQFSLEEDALKEHGHLQLEEDHRIGEGFSTLGTELLQPVLEHAQIDLRHQMPKTVVLGDDCFH